MAQVIVTESYLENIGDAIRSKLGGTDTYKPAEMAGAIAQIHGEPVLEALSVTENGTYNPSSGKDGFSQAIVNVPNSYGAGDEGKVVSNGALVAQTSDTVTENDTYDTTLINQLTVNVSGGGGGGTLITKNITQNGTYNASDDNADGYSSVTVDVNSGGWVYGEATISEQYTYSDRSPVTFTSVLNGIVTRITYDNNNASSGLWNVPTQSNISITYKTEAGGSDIVLPTSDWTLTYTGTSSGNYRYVIEIEPLIFIYSISITFTNVYRVGGEIYASIGRDAYAGYGTPSASLGMDEDIYIELHKYDSSYDHSIGIEHTYRKVNGSWVNYTDPAPV